MSSRFRTSSAPLVPSPQSRRDARRRDPVPGVSVAAGPTIEDPSTVKMTPVEFAATVLIDELEKMTVSGLAVRAHRLGVSETDVRKRRLKSEWVVLVRSRLIELLGPVHVGLPAGNELPAADHIDLLEDGGPSGTGATESEKARQHCAEVAVPRPGKPCLEQARTDDVEERDLRLEDAVAVVPAVQQSRAVAPAALQVRLVPAEDELDIAVAALVSHVVRLSERASGAAKEGLAGARRWLLAALEDETALRKLAGEEFDAKMSRVRGLKEAKLGALREQERLLTEAARAGEQAASLGREAERLRAEARRTRQQMTGHLQGSRDPQVVVARQRVVTAVSPFVIPKPRSSAFLGTSDATKAGGVPGARGGFALPPKASAAKLAAPSSAHPTSWADVARAAAAGASEVVPGASAFARPPSIPASWIPVGRTAAAIAPGPPVVLRNPRVPGTSAGLWADVVRSVGVRAPPVRLSPERAQLPPVVGSDTDEEEEEEEEEGSWSDLVPAQSAATDRPAVEHGTGGGGSQRKPGPAEGKKKGPPEPDKSLRPLLVYCMCGDVASNDTPGGPRCAAAVCGKAMLPSAQRFATRCGRKDPPDACASGRLDGLWKLDKIEVDDLRRWATPGLFISNFSLNFLVSVALRGSGVRFIINLGTDLFGGGESGRAPFFHVGLHGGHFYALWRTRTGHLCVADGLNHTLPSADLQLREVAARAYPYVQVHKVPFAVLQQENDCARVELTGARRCGSQPVRSNISPVSSMVTVTQSRTGFSVKPSLSTKPSAAYTPRGRRSISARVRRSV